jgi:protein TonB
MTAQPRQLSPLSPRSSDAAKFWLEPDRFGMPMAGSAMAHIAGAAAILVWVFWFSNHHGAEWGSSVSATGAIQATLISNAPSIPIPTPQLPTDNVLATDTPSAAPAPPPPVAKPAEPPPDAISIPDKVTPPPKVQPKPQPPQAKPAPQTQAMAKPLTHPLPIPKTTNRANFGEAPPANIPRSSASAAGNGPVSVAGDFGSRYGWYVDVIKRKAQQNWYKAEVDPKTAGGARVYLTFDVARDGSPSRVRIEKSSGSPSLDSSALRALQRIDTFGPLPAGYNEGTLNVEYYFEF